MARIPELEIGRLKAEVNLARLVEASGLKLEKRGADLVCRCPFHEDDTPSFVVTPAKNLYHCFGYGAAGGPIDWVMKRQGMSVRHAVEFLREGEPLVGASTAPAGAVKASTVRALEVFGADAMMRARGFRHRRDGAGGDQPDVQP